MSVSLVEELGRGQTGPVRLLDQLSQAVPAGVWLSRLEHNDDLVRVQGRALGLSALSDLIASMEASGYFGLPVQIVESQFETMESGEVVRFELQAVFLAPDF